MSSTRARRSARQLAVIDPDGVLPLPEFAFGTAPPPATVAFEPEPTLILLYTNGDTPTDWLHAAPRRNGHY
jgi:hypothetical protein